MAEARIPPEVFRLLKEIAANNERAWFEANKQRYVEGVRDPLLRFVAAFGPELRKISKNMVADPRPVGGSLFRIHRDARFSPDKRPYKTQLGMSFRHAEGRDVHGPLFYLHLEPGGCFMAAGMWRPESETLRRVREAIAGQPGRWKRVVAKVALDEGHDALKRPPRGFDPEHPFLEDLKRRSFTASARFSEREVTAPGFLARYAAACRERAPLMEFLAHSAGLPW